DSVHCVAFSADGKFLAWGGADKTVTRLEIAPEKISSFGTFPRDVTGIAFHPDGKQLAVSCKDSPICLFDLGTGKADGTLAGHKGSVLGITYSPDGTLLASCSADNTVLLWGVAARQVHHRLKGHSQQVNRVTFTPDGKRLASASEDRSVKFWNVEDGSE